MPLETVRCAAACKAILLDNYEAMTSLVDNYITPRLHGWYSRKKYPIIRLERRIKWFAHNLAPSTTLSTLHVGRGKMFFQSSNQNEKKKRETTSETPFCISVTRREPVRLEVRLFLNTLSIGFFAFWSLFRKRDSSPRPSGVISFLSHYYYYTRHKKSVHLHSSEHRKRSRRKAICVKVAMSINARHGSNFHSYLCEFSINFHYRRVLNEW